MNTSSFALILSCTLAVTSATAAPAPAVLASAEVGAAHLLAPAQLSLQAPAPRAQNTVQDTAPRHALNPAWLPQLRATPAEPLAWPFGPTGTLFALGGLACLLARPCARLWQRLRQQRRAAALAASLGHAPYASGVAFHQIDSGSTSTAQRSTAL